jgi:hypothetical protein
MYIQGTQPIAPPLGRDAAPEVFVFAGARAKLRVYNAFLQGQFRQSDLTYGEGDVNKTLAEVWARVEWRTASGWALQYFARGESPELRGGSGSRSFTWGSIEISKSFRWGARPRDSRAQAGIMVATRSASSCEQRKFSHTWLSLYRRPMLLLRSDARRPAMSRSNELCRQADLR